MHNWTQYESSKGQINSELYAVQSFAEMHVLTWSTFVKSRFSSLLLRYWKHDVCHKRTTYNPTFDKSIHFPTAYITIYCTIAKNSISWIENRALAPKLYKTDSELIKMGENFVRWFIVIVYMCCITRLWIISGFN